MLVLRSEEYLQTAALPTVLRQLENLGSESTLLHLLVVVQVGQELLLVLQDVPLIQKSLDELLLLGATHALRTDELAVLLAGVEEISDVLVRGFQLLQLMALDSFGLPELGIIKGKSRGVLTGG